MGDAYTFSSYVDIRLRLITSDELFHIIWDDGDEEDYDSKDLRSGEKKYKMLLKENR